MGGHGGLNILPQKKWHLYRSDNRARVARDEAEDRRRKDEDAAKFRAAELDARIGKLRKRAIEASLEVEETPGDESSVPCIQSLENEDELLLIRSQSQLLEKQYVNDSRRLKSKRLCAKTRSCSVTETSKNGRSHVNLFEDVEKLFKKAGDDHAKYLAAVGHTTSDVSDISRIISQSSAPWYLQPKMSNLETETIDKQEGLSLSAPNKSIFVPSTIRSNVETSGSDTEEEHSRKKRNRNSRCSGGHRRHKSKNGCDMGKKEKQSHLEKLREERVRRERAASTAMIE